MHTPFVGEAITCPIPAVWNSRQEQFRRFESMAFGEHGASIHPQVEPLIYELEHSYCAGAWLAALVLAHALVEIFLNSHIPGSKKNWSTFLAPHGLATEIEWLCERRNALLHMKHKTKASVDLDHVLFDRDLLYKDAKRAVSCALRVVFIETRTSSGP
jgi:hypothetical protein